MGFTTHRVFQHKTEILLLVCLQICCATLDLMTLNGYTLSDHFNRIITKRSVFFYVHVINFAWNFNPCTDQWNTLRFATIWLKWKTVSRVQALFRWIVGSRSILSPETILSCVYTNRPWLNVVLRIATLAQRLNSNRFSSNLSRFKLNSSQDFSKYINLE